MKNFFEKNKIFIAIIMGALVIGGLIYLSKLSQTAPPTTEELTIPSKIEITQEESQPPKKQEGLQFSEEKQVAPERYSELKNQIVTIEQILSESSNIRIACLVVGAGNYFEKYGTEEEVRSLSGNYEETKNECFQYYIVYNQIVNFVAEPELVSVKQKFSQIGNVLREFGVYVMLDKGLDGKPIDIYEKDLQELITQTREEILKVKRLYNLEI